MSFKGVSACLCFPDCDICPAVKEDVNIFLTGTPDDYVKKVSQYQSNPVILANAEKLQNCIDKKLTAEDKENALSVLVGGAVCLCLWRLSGGPLRAVWGGGAHPPLHHDPPLGTWEGKEPHEGGGGEDRADTNQVGKDWSSP